MWFHLLNLCIYMVFLACLTSFVVIFDTDKHGVASPGANNTTAADTEDAVYVG